MKPVVDASWIACCALALCWPLPGYCAPPGDFGKPVSASSRGGPPMPVTPQAGRPASTLGLTFTVDNTNDAGAGSLRRAIELANAHPGRDQIDFAITGRIVLTTALPAISDKIDVVAIPDDKGAPQVQIDFNNAAGLRFGPGSAGSKLSGLSLVDAAGDAVTLEARRIIVSGNYIGLDLDGTTAMPNRGDGIRIDRSSSDNIIGRIVPPTETTYTPVAWPSQGGNTTFIQGIRASGAAGSYLMAGSAGFTGLVYEGPIGNASTGTWYTIDANQVLGGASTSVYGPDQLGRNQVRLVGSMRNSATDLAAGTRGFVYTGRIDGSSRQSELTGYRAVSYPGATFTYLHSTSGGLVVGNYDSDDQLVGKAFIYEVGTGRFIEQIAFPGADTTTAYGIIQNRGGAYTIAGGYGLSSAGAPTGHAFMVDYNAVTRKFDHWKSYDLNNKRLTNLISHFEGISANPDGTYTLAGTAVDILTGTPVNGAIATVYRKRNRKYSSAVWTDLDYASSTPGASGITIPTSITAGMSTGLYAGQPAETAYVAESRLAFTLSNVISGNNGNGIAIYGSSGNRIYSNFIGTDATGSIDLGNGANGVLITDGARRNVVGGKATGGNSPTEGVFERPPQGNLISGNDAHGVLIIQGSRRNSLSGNFIGTDATGNGALPNALDGVAIVGSDDNALLGTTFEQAPFVFYNVVSGNGGQGLRIQDSDDITVQANFFGIGANNSTVVANGGNGVLVEGTSANTQFGGVIPLGNVAAGNRLNGIEVRDQVSGFISFNTFCGLYAFGDAAPNQADGILITSTAGNNLLRTNVCSGNLGNGIHLSGEASGVTVDPNIVGLDTKGATALPNGSHGVLVDGAAHHNIIGGTRRSVIPQNTFSGNLGYGLVITGSAHHNEVFNSYIGPDVLGRTIAGNALGGVLIDSVTGQNTIGGTLVNLPNRIDGNQGNGISLFHTRNNTLDSNITNQNRGSGFFVESSIDNLIKGNQSSNNGRYGYESVLSPSNRWINDTGVGNTLGLFSFGP